ncbi:MAG: DUF4388 domain-containing protein [Deltaproteobacteria bacterium]|nr:DUF4388 domain-containing protein [Deltaproteobacteria bacterium]
MSAESGLKGQLQFLSLPEVLQLLNSSGSTGVLRIKSPHLERPGEVFFCDGEVMDAVCGQREGIEAVYSLFGWSEGDFEFVHRKVNSVRKIKSGVMELIMDGLRKLDEGEIEKIGPPKEDDRDSPAKGTHLPIISRTESNYAYVVAEEEIRHGEHIVQEGKYGSWVSVILEGYADVQRNTEKGPLAIARLGPGALVGNISNVLTPKNIRTATLCAVGNVVLGVLDLRRVHAEFAAMKPDLRAYCVSLGRRLQQVTDRVVETYTGKLDAKSFLAGKKTMFKQGADENGVYRVVEGEAVIVAQKGKDLVPLCKLKENDFIGHPFLDVGQEYKNAAVMASEDCSVAGVDGAEMVKGFQEVSPLIRTIVDHEANCIANTTNILLTFEERYPSQKKGKKN